MVCLASWSVNFFLRLYLKEKRREEKTRGEDIREEKRREENKTGGKKGSGVERREVSIFRSRSYLSKPETKMAVH